MNGAPSLSADTVRDHELKYGVLDDTLTVIDMEKKYARCLGSRERKRSELKAGERQGGEGTEDSRGRTTICMFVLCTCL